jgi:hypothetical protein
MSFLFMEKIKRILAPTQMTILLPTLYLVFRSSQAKRNSHLVYTY